MKEEERLEAFEKMLAAVRQQYELAEQKLQLLKAEGKEKTVTFRQLMGDKLMYRQMLSLYAVYGLLEE